MDIQKAQVDIEKHGCEMMMSAIVFLRSVNYGRSGNWKTQGEVSRGNELFTRLNVKMNREYLEA